MLFIIKKISIQYFRAQQDRGINLYNYYPVMKTCQEKDCSKVTNLKKTVYRRSTSTIDDSENHQLKSKIINKEITGILKDTIYGMAMISAKRSASMTSRRHQSSSSKVNQAQKTPYNSTLLQTAIFQTVDGRVTYDHLNRLEARKRRFFLASSSPNKKGASSKNRGLFQLTSSFAKTKPLVKRQKTDDTQIYERRSRICQKQRKDKVPTHNRKSRIIHDKEDRYSSNVSTPSSFGDEEYTFPIKRVPEYQKEALQRIKSRRNSYTHRQIDTLKPWLQNEQLFIFNNALLGPTMCLSDLLD